MDKYYLIYDDSCSLCFASVNKLKEMDKTGRVELFPISSVSLPEQFNLPSQEELSKEIHLYDSKGKVYKGSLAITKLALLFPDTKLWGRLLSLPLIKPLGQLIYKLIARLRYKISTI